MPAGTGNMLILALPLLLLGFLMWSQKRRSREQQQIQASLEIGQEVMTSSGMFGRIIALEDAVVILEVAPGVQVRFDRRAVTRPSTPPSGSAAATGDEPEEQPAREQ